MLVLDSFVERYFPESSFAEQTNVLILVSQQLLVMHSPIITFINKSLSLTKTESRHSIYRLSVLGGIVGNFPCNTTVLLSQHLQQLVLICL